MNGRVKEDRKNRMEKKGRGAQITTERKSGSRTTKNTTVSIKATWL